MKPNFFRSSSKFVKNYFWKTIFITAIINKVEMFFAIDNKYIKYFTARLWKAVSETASKGIILNRTYQGGKVAKKCCWNLNQARFSAYAPKRPFVGNVREIDTHCCRKQYIIKTEKNLKNMSSCKLYLYISIVVCWETLYLFRMHSN